MTMDHERCGELLLPHVRGELDETTAREVDEHLVRCSECRAERDGLDALLAEPVEPLTDLERAALHRDLRSRVSVPAGTGAQRKDRLAWLPSALGVAALLLAVVVGMQISGGGGDDEAALENAGSGADLAAPDGPRPVTLTLSSRGVRESEVASEEVLESDTARGEEEPPSSEAAPDSLDDAVSGQDSGYTITSRDRLTVEDRLTAYARTSPVFTRFARTYTVEDVDSLTDPFINDLAAEAPPGAAVQVTECADLVVTSREFPTLPAAAAHGKFRGHPSLLLGFVWTQEESGPLDNYVLYVWPTGSCDSPAHSQSGRIRTRGG
jgi:hypothetical protein